MTFLNSITLSRVRWPVVAMVLAAALAVVALGLAPGQVLAQAIGDRQESLEFILHSGNDDSGGIAVSETKAYVVDPIDDRVYVYRLSDGDRQTSEEFNLFADNSTSTGLSLSSVNAYVVDSHSDRVYVYRLSDGDRQPSEEFNLHSDNDFATGLALSSVNAYVVDSVDKKVYVYRLSDGDRQTSEEFNLHSDNGFATGLAVRSANAYVVDLTDDKVYVYRLSDGDRQTSEEFSLHSDNDNPSGLAVRSANAYVVDLTDDKVYVYSSPDSPSFSSATGSLDLANNTNSGGNVGPPVTATGGSGDITYSLSGADAASFDINTSTGQITLASGVTIRAVGQTYTVTVTATDTASDTDTITVTITVTGANTAPAFAGASVSRAVGENSGVGTNVGEPVTATDANSDTLTYSLGGTDAGNYDIDSGSGQITVASGTELDYESDPSDMVTVTATDPYGATASVPVSITITDMRIAGEISEPPNVQVSRSSDNQTVTITWSPPEEGADNYTVQRQELVVAGGSSFFGNSTTVGGPGWLPGDTLTYDDGDILPGQIYEYRVAALKGEVVGGYSDWFRTAPVETEYGDAPENLRLDGSTARDDRREYWLVWDEVDGTTDYELERLILSPDGRQTVTPGIIVTEPMYFWTGYSLNRWRVRGRKSDADLCGSGAADYCYTGWTGWFQVGFQPLHKVATPTEATESTRSTAMQAEVDEFHTSVVSFVEDTMSISGVTVDGQGILNTGVMVAGVIPAGIATWRGRRTGMIGIGMGSGVAYFVMTLALGVRLLELPVSWIIVSVMVVLVGGGLAAVKVLGLFGRGS